MRETAAASSRAPKVQSLALPITGVVLAIAFTTSMDATGLSTFSALALLPLFLLFWWLSHLSRTQIGFKIGYASDYGMAILFPVAVRARSR